MLVLPRTAHSIISWVSDDHRWFAKAAVLRRAIGPRSSLCDLAPISIVQLHCSVAGG